MEQNRFKSPVLWTSVAALIFFVAKNWFGFSIPNWDTFVDLIIAVLVGFGVLNNPTSKAQF
ncbi:MAG: holin [Clostridia bacterium]|nr:holin [Clostridia bacterium]